MFLKSLHIANYKNYEECHLTFSPRLNIFTGPNGSGKTNLLDSIYFLCLTKSTSSGSDSLIIRHQEEYMIIQGIIHKKDKKLNLHAGIKRGQKKIFSLNKKIYEKISEHIGQFPAVLISPYDTDLVREGSEERRKFFDTVLSQTDSQYLQNLLKYNKVLKHRNALLKDFAIKNYIDKDLLSTYDIQLLDLGEKIFRKRKEAMENINPIFDKYYQEVAGSKEQVSLVYDSDFMHENYQDEFIRARKKDLILQRTTKGIHKDDFLFGLSDHPLKQIGSQGQQKSFVIALKLSQYEYIKQNSGLEPILLLDDIFDKLDQNRIQKLIHMIESNNFGQVFITEAGEDRVEKYFQNLETEICTFTVLDGKVSSK
jgi:DNA replication and repair protein RecF